MLHLSLGISFITRDFILHFSSVISIILFFTWFLFFTWYFSRHSGFHLSLGNSLITQDFLHHLGFHSSLHFSNFQYSILHLISILHLVSIFHLVSILHLVLQS